MGLICAVPQPWRVSVTNNRSRIGGLDLARAAALIGMFAAHVGDGGTAGVYAGDRGWQWIVDGRSAVLFAVLGGVTSSLMFTRDRQGPRHAAVRIAFRATLLIALGYALAQLGTPVDVVLTNLGFMFLFALPFAALRARVLAVLGTAWLGLGALVFPSIVEAWAGIPLLERVVSYHYPAAVWTGFVLIGMALGKADLRQRSTVVTMLKWGGLGIIAGYGGGVAFGAQGPWVEGVGRTITSLEAHSYSVFELIGNSGVAVVVIATCLGVARGQWWLEAATSFGSMSLTMYTAHLLVIAVVGEDMVWAPSQTAFVLMSLALITFATLWKRIVGQGPFEQFMTWSSNAVASALIDEGPTGANSPAARGRL